MLAHHLEQSGSMSGSEQGFTNRVNMLFSHAKILRDKMLFDTV